MNKDSGKVYVQWSVMSILLVILASILGVMWSEIRSVREAETTSRQDVVQIKTDVAWIKKLIQGGELTILKNGTQIKSNN